jgi:hypothetical protein
METSRESQLKTWSAGDTYVTSITIKGKDTKRKVAEVICPNCHAPHVVIVKAWWAADRHKAAPCTYCFRTAWRGNPPA